MRDSGIARARLRLALAVAREIKRAYMQGESGDSKAYLCNRANSANKQWISLALSGDWTRTDKVLIEQCLLKECGLRLWRYREKNTPALKFRISWGCGLGAPVFLYLPGDTASKWVRRVDRYIIGKTRSALASAIWAWRKSGLRDGSPVCYRCMDVFQKPLNRRLCDVRSAVRVLRRVITVDRLMGHNVELWTEQAAKMDEFISMGGV